MKAGDLVLILGGPVTFVGCIAVVDEVRTWGVCAHVRAAAVGGYEEAHIRLRSGDYVCVGEMPAPQTEGGEA